MCQGGGVLAWYPQCHRHKGMLSFSYAFLIAQLYLTLLELRSLVTFSCQLATQLSV